MPADTAQTALEVRPAARTFVVTATGASLAAFNLGFDLGAFENVDHRKIWAIWVLSTVALISSYALADADYKLGGSWRLALLPCRACGCSPTSSSPRDSQAVVTILLVASVIALPFALYVLARLVAGDFFELTNRLRWVLIATVLLVFAVGWYVGDGHERFLSCADFELAGEYTPENCVP